MRNFTYRCPKSGHFPPKLGQFFPIFEKGQGRPLPPPPPSSYAPENLCQSLMMPATLLKKETLAQVFSCEFCDISKNTFLQNISGRLLLFYFRKKAPPQMLDRLLNIALLNVLITDHSH